MNKVNIRYRPGRENSSANSLSRSPIGAVPSEEAIALPTCIVHIESSEEVSTLMGVGPGLDRQSSTVLGEQKTQ